MMGITEDETLAYWNYFLALEEDLYKISRYIEFKKDNFKTYSFELAKLLIAATSQVDVVLRDITSQHTTKSKDKLNINDYIKVLCDKPKYILTDPVEINRFQLKLIPFTNLKNTSKRDKIPNWWTAYNNVKHNMNTDFNQANLENTLNALAALFIVVDLYYTQLSETYGTIKDTRFNEFNIKCSRQQGAILFSSRDGMKKKPVVF